MGSRNAVRRYREYVAKGLDADMDDWGLGEESPLSLGDGVFRDWVKDKYAKLVTTAKHQEDVAFRPTEKALSPDTILAILAEIMECDSSSFSRRVHRQPHRPFAAQFLTRFGRLTRREAAQHLGVGSGPAVSRQLVRYGQLVGESRRLKKLAALCEERLQAASGLG